jgi:hypothetical protein
MKDNKVKGYRTVSELSLRLNEITTTLKKLSNNIANNPQLNTIYSLAKNTHDVDYILGQIYSNFNVESEDVVALLNAACEIKLELYKLQNETLHTLHTEQKTNSTDNNLSNILDYLSTNLDNISIVQPYCIHQKTKDFYIYESKNLSDIKGFSFNVTYLILLYSNQTTRIKVVGALDKEAFDYESNYKVINSLDKLTNFLLRSGLYGN